MCLICVAFVHIYARCKRTKFVVVTSVSCFFPSSSSFSFSYCTGLYLMLFLTSLQQMCVNIFLYVCRCCNSLSFSLFLWFRSFLIYLCLSKTQLLAVVGDFFLSLIYAKIIREDKKLKAILSR
jgi:hypothetical protein